MIDTIAQFREAIRLAGLRLPETIYDDGQLHRFGTNDKQGDKAGWYILYGDGIPAGSFGDWRTGANHTWRADMGRKLSEQEASEHQKKVDAMRRAREQAEEKRHLQACESAKRIWNNATEPSPEHLYLKQKSIKAYGLREHEGRLVVPIWSHGVLHSLQFISPEGNKRFLSGGKVKEGYFMIGRPTAILCICEGYATGASIFAATDYAVAVAFNAGNLVSVAQVLRKKFPEAQLILCADDDCRTSGNPGISKAREAADRVGGLLVVPNFGKNRPEGSTDFNDLHQLCGIEAVTRIIRSAIMPMNSARISNNNITKNQTEVELICAADLDPEPINWIWKDWLAAGKFHLLAGAPGTGKTTLALNLAAIITRGDCWPDGTLCSESGNVLIWSGEDDAKDTLLPRLSAHGADLERVYFVSDVNEQNGVRAFDPSRDIPKLYKKASEMSEIRLIIIDPVVNAVLGDSHKNGEVRRALQPLIELGEKLKAVILGISHFSKGSTGRDPLERVNGSIAFGALARVVLATAKITDPNGSSTRLFVRTKSNHGPDGGAFHYQIEQIELAEYPGVISSQVIWGDFVAGSARELLTDSSDQNTHGESSILADAMDFLNVLLADGALFQKEIIIKAKEAGFSEMTLRRAKKCLKIKSMHDGYGKGSVWKWCLPHLEEEKS